MDDFSVSSIHRLFFWLIHYLVDAADDKVGCGIWHITLQQFEPHCEKTGLRGFRPDPTQTGLYN